MATPINGMTSRWDHWCRDHLDRVELCHSACPRYFNDPVFMAAILVRVRVIYSQGTANLQDLRYPDFCLVCNEHESEHVNRRCLLVPAKFTPGYP